MYTKLIVAQEDEKCLLPILQRVRLDSVYFHGDYLPFSLDATDSDLVYTVPTSYSGLCEGCHQVSINHKGRVYVNYRLYFWYDRRGKQHGLVVNPLDKEATNYARRSLKRRAYSI